MPMVIPRAVLEISHVQIAPVRTERDAFGEATDIGLRHLEGWGRIVNVTNFVVERRRLVRQRRRQVVGEANSDGAASHREVVPQQEADNSDPLSHPEVPPQLAETQLGEPPAPTVWGKLKWFNPGKRYGFVELSDGSGDAFLHASALAGMSIDALQPGVTLEFRTAPARRGLQVTEVMSVDSSTAAPPRPPRKNFRAPLNRQPLETSVQEMGTVKWYNAAKGFGFIVLGSGEMRLRVAGRRRQGLPREPFRARDIGTNRGGPSGHHASTQHVCQAALRLGGPGVECQGVLKQAYRLRVAVARRRLPECGHAPQNIVERVGSRGRPGGLSGKQLQVKRSRDAARDLVLQSVQIGCVAVEPLCPQMGVRLAVDQLGSDPQPSA